jgi:hypothetical protein
MEEGISLDSFNYALENTQVVVPPQRRLETFGATVLDYYLVTEVMDVANLSRVREGQIFAERPELISPMYFSKLLLDGFGEKARLFADAINANAHQFAILKYGFSIRKSDIKNYEVHEPLVEVVDRVKTAVLDRQNPLSVVLTGVDDAWEVCLLKFMFDLISTSGDHNVRDLKKRGLI